jgi:hypothetical protein
VTAWTIGRVRASGEAYLRELGHARVLALRGRASTSPADLRERYAYELGRGALDVVLEQANLAGPDSPDARSARVLLDWLTRLAVDDVCAPMDAWISRWTTSAIVRTSDGRAVPFLEVGRVISHERDRASRHHLDAARAEIVTRDLVATVRERNARERDTIESVGIGSSMLEAATRLTGADFTALAATARDALARSADAWRDSLGERLHRQASIGIDEARPADLIAAVGLAEFDGAFPRSLRSLTMRRLVAEMGLDPDAGGRMHIEPALVMTAPPAESIPVEVPNEVHIVLGADDGFVGYRRALQILGRGLRLVHVQEDAAFEHRWLGNHAANEIGGLTLRLVLLDGEWLMRYAGLTRGEAETVVRRAALAALHELRHALATLLFHIQSVDAGLAAGAIEELYVETIGSAIGIRPNGSDALLFAPPLLHPASRVEAWQGASVLAESLVERFDVDWYRNPRSGPWLVQGVFAPACGEVAAEMVKGATAREPSLRPYIDHLERLLSA